MNVQIMYYKNKYNFPSFKNGEAQEMKICVTGR